MTDFVSPYLKAAAERAAYRSPLEMPIKVPAIKLCPNCGKTPAINPEFYNQVCIHCDNDECADRDMQAMGHTLEEAAQKWNLLGTEAVEEEEYPDRIGAAMDRARDRWEETEAGKGGLK